MAMLRLRVAREETRGGFVRLGDVANKRRKRVATADKSEGQSWTHKFPYSVWALRRMYIERLSAISANAEPGSQTLVYLGISYASHNTGGIAGS